MRRGAFVGRFQPFHNGHLEIIKKIVKEVDELVIIVGSSQYSHKLDNPFTAGERITMIRRALKEEGIQLSRIWIIPVPDVYQHALWSMDYLVLFVLITARHLQRQPSALFHVYLFGG